MGKVERSTVWLILIIILIILCPPLARKFVP